MKISVIISTYNRYKTLSDTLDCLCQQKIDGVFDYEVIVVDNNSKDQTKETIEAFVKKDPKFLYIFEPKQGVSNARNAGANNATGEILAFTDDDVLIDKNWLLNIAQFSLECDFDALGGKVLALYPKDTPQWIKDCKDILTGPILYYDCGETIQLYNAMLPPFVGANMIVKRNVFEELEGFKPDIGAGKGTVGEDTEYFHRLRKVNKRIFYNPKVLIFHPVEKNRMNLKYFAKWHMNYGKYLVLKSNEKDENMFFILGIPRYLYRECIDCLWKMIKSINNKRQFIEVWCALFDKVGMIFAYRLNIKGN